MDNNMCNEMVASLESSANTSHAAQDKRYHKYDSYKSYGIKSPQLIRILKQYKKNIEDLECEAALTVAGKLYSSGIEEQLMAGNYIVTLKSECLTLPRQTAYIDRLADNFMSWSTVDDFCIDVLQPLLFRQPKQTLTVLRKWNKSKNMWKRRASVVAFVRKAGESGRFTKEAIELCDNLKHDKEDLVPLYINSAGFPWIKINSTESMCSEMTHYNLCKEALVRKAVGWALKDTMRGDKVKVLEYVKQLRF